MDLTTNGVVLTDAIEFIEWSNEKLNFLQRKKRKTTKITDYVSYKKSLFIKTSKL